jgi:uncharacterized protein
MRIAVISDSHDELPAALPALLAEADEIWHLGDVSDPRTLVELELLNCPLHIVSGNCDDWPAWPRVCTLEHRGHVFHLEHIPPLRPSGRAQTVLHGHTHVPRDETDQLGVRWLNPGSVSEPRYSGPPSFAWLTLSETPGAPFNWELVFL